MDIREVKDLIHEVLQSDISEFELEHGGTRVRLKRGFSRESTSASAASGQPLPAVFSHRPTAAVQPAAPVEPAEDIEDGAFHTITSPIVGTVYCSPSSGTEPYVKLGDHVHEGSILCIIEAMKLMNEIPSDAEGEIVRIYIENGNPVEFGQKLFAIRPQKQG
ncbi:MAG: acetyl-CoA carboxylase biotin carboxyl carrier protein [Acidobacteriota bacterium]|jgi:acetyl-CoA carboxylase biotin carboxyl carrier protein